VIDFIARKEGDKYNAISFIERICDVILIYHVDNYLSLVFNVLVHVSRVTTHYKKEKNVGTAAF
jgi:hypothetical protein